MSINVLPAFAAGSIFIYSDTVLIYVNSHFNSGGEFYAKRKRIGTEKTSRC